MAMVTRTFLFSLALLWQSMGMSIMVSTAWSEPSLLSSRRSGVQNGNSSQQAYTSALGDPGMKSDKVRVGVEGWNFCNGAKVEELANFSSTAASLTPSPRWADCTDLVCSSTSSTNSNGQSSCKAVRKVSNSDNNLVPGDAFPGGQFVNSKDPDEYAIEKEKYLGSLCAVDTSSPDPWSFWMIMLKNGNFDIHAGLCEEITSNSSSGTANPPSASPSAQPTGNFPCFGTGCMNQPIVFHDWSKPQLLKQQQTTNVSLSRALEGSFSGTYDLTAGATSRSTISDKSSFFSVTWYKNESGGSWNFHHVLRTSQNYSWLMLYLRADATSGLSGGYPWDTRGMMQKVPESPNFKVTFKLTVLNGGGASSQFYLMDIGGCWKNNGKQCDGDRATDVTRYSEMIINPDISSWCSAGQLQSCPPYHTSADGAKIHRTDTINFPYSAYHYYCVPGNAQHAEVPFVTCDPYSNPQSQELMQLLPHPEWAVNGYPATKGDGWIGDPRTWNLDVGALSSRLFFYQDPGTTPATRKWPSLDVGTEIFRDVGVTAEWILSDFDVLIPS